MLHAIGIGSGIEDLQASYVRDQVCGELRQRDTIMRSGLMKQEARKRATGGPGR